MTMTQSRLEMLMVLTSAINENPGNTSKVTIEQVASFAEQETEAAIDVMIGDTKFNDTNKVTAEDVLASSEAATEEAA